MFTTVSSGSSVTVGAQVMTHRRPGSESNPTRWSKKVGPTAFSPRGTRQGLESKRRGEEGRGSPPAPERVRSKGVEIRMGQRGAGGEKSPKFGLKASGVGYPG